MLEQLVPRSLAWSQSTQQTKNYQCCLEMLGVSFYPSKLGCMIAPVSNVGRLLPSLGYNIVFFLKFDDNIGLQILLIPNVVLNIGWCATLGFARLS